MTQSNKVVPLFGVPLKEGEEKYIDIEPPVQYLSFYDLQGVVGFQSAKETQNTAELERILWEHGADISKPYYIKKCLHRPRTSNIPYDGFRIEFTERVDKEHLLSGIASEEAKLFTTDQSLADELASLDPRNPRNTRRSFDEDVGCGVDISYFGEDA